MHTISDHLTLSECYRAPAVTEKSDVRELLGSTLFYTQLAVKTKKTFAPSSPFRAPKTTDLASDPQALVLTQVTHRSIPLPPLNRPHRALCDPLGQKGWKVQSLKGYKESRGAFFPP